jgi:iron complex outermembrane receptor protein
MNWSQVILLRTASVAAIATAALATPLAALAAAAPATSAENGGGVTTLEEVVVTAQKREEKLQDVPISITAFSVKAIETNRIQNVSDLNGLAPNLIVLPQTGGGDNPVYSLRGIVGTGAVPGQDKGVSLYVDGVYMSANSGAIFDLSDIQRIEVLKGPQGTLFGRNATGGAISVVTSNPTGEFGLRQNLTVGNYKQFRSKTHIELPSVGPFSASLSFLHNERRGDIRNLGAGTQWNYGVAAGGEFGTLTSPKYLGDNKTDAVAATVRFRPIDALDVVYKFDHTNSRYTENGQGLLAAGDPLFGGLFVSALIGLQPPANASLLTPFGNKRPDAVNAAFSTPGRAVNYGHNLTASYAFNEVVSIKNILAYRDTREAATSDVSGAGGLVITPGILDALGVVNPGTRAFLQGQPIVVYAVDTDYHQHQFSNETQININLSKAKITTGLYIFKERVVNGGFNNVSPTLFFSPIPFHTINADGSKKSDIQADSKALFGQIEYNIVSNLTVVGGLRQTWDHKYGVDNATLGVVNNYGIKQDKLTWLAGLNYKPNSDTLLYAKASTGFISGGIYNGASFVPETATSYEVGVKADMSDRRLRTNLALFDAEYDELQNLKAASNGVIVANVGKARALGAEFEGTLVPMRGVTLTAGVGLLDFKYLRLDPGVGVLSNYRPDNRPKVTATLAAQYQAPEFSWGGKFTAHIDGQYTSRVNGVPAPIPTAVAAETFPAHWLLNGRLSLGSIPVAKSKVEVALWGRNILDDKSPIYSADLRFIYSAVYQPARTFGLDVNFEF